MYNSYDVVWNRELCVRKCAYELYLKFNGNEKYNWYSAEKEILATPLFIIIDVKKYIYIEKKYKASDINYINDEAIIDNKIKISRRRLYKNYEIKDLYIIGELIN